MLASGIRCPPRADTLQLDLLSLFVLPYSHAYPASRAPPTQGLTLRMAGGGVLGGGAASSPIGHLFCF